MGTIRRNGQVIAFSRLKFWAVAVLAVASLVAGAGARGSTAAAPVNDNFASAFVLTGSTDSRIGDTNVEATLETGEDAFVTVGDVDIEAHHSIWYRWTAPSDGWATVSLEGSNFDTLLGIYTGTAVNALTRVASNDDGNDIWSIVSFHVTAATTYRMRVDGFGDSSGTVDIHLNEVPNPPNDNFANAITVPSTGDLISGSNAGATLETGEPETIGPAPGVKGGASVWYTWSPSASELITIDTATSAFDTLLAVYTGSAVGALTPVASNDDADPPIDKTSTVTFNASLGTTYRIRVDGFQGAQGNFKLHVFLANTPGPPTNVTGTPGDASVALSWTAPVSNGGTPITNYEITPYIGASAQTTIEVGPVTQKMITGLTNGTAYTFKVAAKNAIGIGPQSADSAALTPKGNQTINVTSHAPAAATFGTSFSVTATGGASGNPVTFSSSGVCTNSGNTFTMTSGTGTCTVKYDQAGSASYNSAPQVTESVTAQKSSQAITVTTHAPATALSGSSFTVAATAPGGAVSYSSSGSCSNTGAAFTMTSGTGTCAVQYDQPGNANYNAASQVVESVTATTLPPPPPPPTTQQFTLTVTKTGTGTGSVASTPVGITCGTTCAASFNAGTTVTLTATADAQSTFAGWSGACTGTSQCTVTLDAAKTVTATFNQVLAPTPTPTPKPKCVVPNVKGKTLAAAKKKIVAAHCRTGRVTTAKSAKVAKGRVISQKPKAGARLSAGTKINLVVSRGRR